MIGPSIVVPDPAGYQDWATPDNRDGLRVTEFHLADRNEGGLFSGKSEVYVHCTMYRSQAPLTTYLTDNGVPSQNRFTWYDEVGIQRQSSYGKQLAEVRPQDISVSSNVLIRPAAGDDWTLVGDGLSANGQYGYDQIFLSFYEKDGGSNSSNLSNPYTQLTLAAIPKDFYHVNLMTLSSDIWFSNRYYAISYQDILNNGGALWLAEGIAGAWHTQLSQPPADHSWFKIELF